MALELRNAIIMSEYCSRCSPFETYDYDLTKIALNLENGHSENILCEGCNIRGVYKDESGNLYLAVKTEKKIEMKAVNIEEL